MKVKQAAQRWGISDRKIRVLCAESKIFGVYREGKVGHKEAFDLVSELIRDNVSISESIIKQIHDLVLVDKRMPVVYTAEFLGALWALSMSRFSHISFGRR